MAEDKNTRIDDKDAQNLPDDGADFAKKEKRGAKPRRRGRSVTAIVLLSLAILLFAGGGLMGLAYYKSYQNLEDMKAAVEAEGFYPGIMINGQDVGGRAYEDVRSEVLTRQAEEAAARVITVKFEGQTFALPAQSAYDTEQVLVDAYNYAKEGDLQERYQKVVALRTQPLDFVTNCTVTMDGVDTFVRQIAASIDIEAVDATVGAFDAESKTFTFTQEVNGRALDAEKLRADITAAVESGNFATTIVPTVSDVPAAVTKAQLESQNTLLAAYTTQTTSSTSRNTNIRLCAAAFNGYVLAPGETFSLNTLTGPRTTAKGYREAGAIQNGIMVQEPGGGVCQVSSTLFNAVVRAGLQVDERHGHSWPSDYVSIGMDAAIDYPAKDFRFTNTSDAPLYLVSTFVDRTLTVEIYGKPLLEPGVTIDLRSTTDATIERGEDMMVFDASVAPGENVTVRRGRDGKKSTTYIQYLRDGEVYEEKVLFTTTYPAIRAIINYGPEIVYNDIPEESLPPEESDNIW